MPQTLTLMAVHAHPDDEAIGTGGVLALAAAHGIRTILVTCTGGEVGEIAPESGATAETLGAVRERELRNACEILGVTHLELLGYRDSGMAGTADNENPASFSQADLGVATARLAALVRKYQPSVLVTYNENGFYGHPDHINAHRITVGAYDLAADESHASEDDLAPWAPAKLYYTAVSRSAMKRFGQRLRELGIEAPIGDGGDGEGDAEQAEGPDWGTPDELITTVVINSSGVPQGRSSGDSSASGIGGSMPASLSILPKFAIAERAMAV